MIFKIYTQTTHKKFPQGLDLNVTFTLFYVSNSICCSSYVLSNAFQYSNLKQATTEINHMGQHVQIHDPVHI